MLQIEEMFPQKRTRFCAFILKNRKMVNMSAKRIRMKRNTFKAQLGSLV
jgi:hypothetical protein